MDQKEMIKTRQERKKVCREPMPMSCHQKWGATPMMHAMDLMHKAPGRDKARQELNDGEERGEHRPPKKKRMGKEDRERQH